MCLRSLAGWAGVLVHLCSFPSSPSEDGVRAHVWCGRRLGSVLAPAGSAPVVCWSSVWCPCLGLCPAANSELVWTKGNDKLGVGVTQECYKKVWYEFPKGGQGPSKHREGKAHRDEGQGGWTREGACE
jgi:hypothetical protein